MEHCRLFVTLLKLFYFSLVIFLLLFQAIKFTGERKLKRRSFSKGSLATSATEHGICGAQKKDIRILNLILFPADGVGFHQEIVV